VFVDVVLPVVVSRLRFPTFQMHEAKGALHPCLVSASFWHRWILEYILLTRRHSVYYCREVSWFWTAKTLKCRRVRILSRSLRSHAS
jgi:hypothetical protein